MRPVHRSIARLLVVPTLVLAAAAAPTHAQVTVGGAVYAQWGAQMDSLSPANNFDITRAYVNVVGRFDGGIGTRLTGDIYQSADGSHTYRLKYAFATWTPSGSALTYKLGLIHTPWIDWEEVLWDYRMQGPVPVDRNKYASSADFGAGVDGTWNGDRLNLQIAAVNGENYSGPPGDQHKDVAARVSLRVLDTDDSSRVGGLRITGYGQLGAPTGGGHRNRFIGMASYRSRLLVLAVEYVATTDSVTTPATATTHGSVIAVYGVFRHAGSPLGIIGRVDIVDPNTANNTTATRNDKRTTVIVGFSYQLRPTVRLLADVDHTSLQGSVTGSTTAPRTLTQGLFQMQFTF